MNIIEWRAQQKEIADSKEQPVTEPVVEAEKEVPVVEEVVEITPTETTTPDKLIVDGEEVTLDDVREWRKGNLRQKDYTQKTQALANEKAENQNAIDLFNHLKANPQLAQALLTSNADTSVAPTLKGLDPTASQVDKLQKQVYDLMIEREIDQLTHKYSDFEILDVLSIAQEKNILDLEDAYLLLKGKKNATTPTTTPAPVVDEQVQQSREDMRKELMKEIEDEKNSTSTIISSNSNRAPDTSSETDNLTPAEKGICKKMNLSEEEYVKWKKKK